jgi:hypothetical protein
MSEELFEGHTSQIRRRLIKNKQKRFVTCPEANNAIANNVAAASVGKKILSIHHFISNNFARLTFSDIIANEVISIEKTGRRLCPSITTAIKEYSRRQHQNSGKSHIMMK